MSCPQVAFQHISSPVLGVLPNICFRFVAPLFPFMSLFNHYFFRLKILNCIKNIQIDYDWSMCEVNFLLIVVFCHIKHRRFSCLVGKGENSFVCLHLAKQSLQRVSVFLHTSCCSQKNTMRFWAQSPHHITFLPPISTTTTKLTDREMLQFLVLMSFLIFAILTEWACHGNCTLRRP